MPKLIREYHQSKDGRWYAGEVKSGLVGVGASKASDYEPTDTSEGVCFGLSIWWIIKTAQKVAQPKAADFWSWMEGPGPQVGDIKSLFKSQRDAGALGGTERFLAADEKIRAETSLKHLTEVLVNTGTKFDGPGYYYLSLRGFFPPDYEKITGHAVAFYFSDQVPCRYFDPNFGEYEADSQQATVDGLSELVTKYKIKSPKFEWSCWG